MLGIIDREKLYLFLRELSEYFYGDEGKGGIWGPTMPQYDNNKPKSWPSAMEILLRSEFPTDLFGWEMLLERNNLSVPALAEQEDRFGMTPDEVYSMAY